MAYEIKQEDVWVSEIEDRPGGLNEKLKTIADAGVDLEFMVSRRDKPGKGVVFITATDPTSTGALDTAGLSKWDSGHSLRVQGPDRAKLGAQIAQVLVDNGINMRGISASKLGKEAVFHIAFDNAADSAKARQALTSVL